MVSRVVEFRTSPRSAQDTLTERGSVARLLACIPYLLIRGFIPPLPVVNEVLRSGGVDAGMSGAVEWTGFELSVDEFGSVVEELVQGSVAGRSYHFEDVPAWVTSRDDWSVWLAGRLEGIPIEENRRLHWAMAELRRGMEQAEACGDEDRRIRYLLELNSVCSEWSGFIGANRRGAGKR